MSRCIFKPNVVVILTDQWSVRASDGSGDYEVLQTPAVDTLAQEGIRFNRAYSSYPVCSPARASIYTGLMPHKHGLTANAEVIAARSSGRSTALMPDDFVSMGQVFKANGYDTAYFGKDHTAGIAWRGIDSFGSMKFPGAGALAEGNAFDQVFTRDAIQYIRQDRERPFYMTLSLINPHDICHVPSHCGPMSKMNFADCITFFRDEDSEYLRYQDRPKLPVNHAMPAIQGMTQNAVESTRYDADYWRNYLSVYYLLVEKSDWFISLLLQQLRAIGLYDSTIVVFTSDHGDMMSSHSLMQKNTFYEEACRVPLIMRYPGCIEPGMVDNISFVGSVDIMPTLLELCGLKPCDGIDGKSFAARCFGKAEGDFDHLFAETSFGRMLRFGDYKYVNSIVDNKEHKILIDLGTDPYETANVFRQPGYRRASASAEKAMHDWLNKEAIGISY